MLGDLVGWGCHVVKKEKDGKKERLVMRQDNSGLKIEATREKFPAKRMLRDMLEISDVEYSI